MRGIVAWCLGHKSVVILGALIVLVLGLSTAGNLKREILPPVDFPLLNVITVVPGSDPKSVEEEVTKPIEAKVAGMKGLKRYRSYSVDGVSTVLVEYDLSTNIKEAQSELERALSDITLPEGTQSPKVSRIGMDSDVALRLAVIANGASISEMTEKVREEVVPLLSKAGGVAAVNLRGGTEQRIEVRLDPKKMSTYRISADQVVGTLKANNLALPVGAMEEGKLTVPVRVGSEIDSVDDLRKLVVEMEAPAPAAPRPIELSDIAEVKIARKAVSGISRTDGKDSLSLEIIKEQGANSVALSQGVKDKFPEIKRLLGKSDLKLVFDEADFIQKSISDLLREALIGAVLVVVIVFLFLKSVRATLVTVISIPVSLLVGLIFASRADLSLNIMTLSGLTIAIGRVIDDAIVVMENIFSRIQMGEDPDSAALNGTTEVSSAIASSTLTAVAVFLPIGLVGGLISKFFLSFSLVVALALLASLLVSVTLVPVLANTLLRRGVRHQTKTPLLQRIYLPMLRWSLRHRAWTVVIGFLIFAGSLALLTRIPQNFMPSTGENQLIAEVELPPGTSLQESSRRLEPFERAISAEEDINVYSVDIGGTDPFAGGGFTQPENTATVWIQLEDDAEVGPMRRRLQQRGQELYGAEFRIEQAEGGPQAGGIEVVLANTSSNRLKQASDKVLERLEDVQDIENIESNLSEAKPEVSVEVDRKKALQRGLSAAQIAAMLRTMLQGEEVGKVAVDGTSLPVVVAAASGSLDGVDELAVLPVGGSGSGAVKLRDVAKLSKENGPVTLSRDDGDPAVSITGRITAQDTARVSSNIEKAIDKADLPSGTEVRYGGDAEMMSEGFTDMGIAMLIAVVLVYLVLVVFFGSLLHPFTIILSLPLASIGALGALLVTGQALGLPALLGMLMLIGIVVANAILLVDFIQKARARGESKDDAELGAGRRRLRPILMTAIVTMGALFPLAAGLSGGILISASLATVVIGGLATSTLLTLVIIPAVYSLLDSGRDRLFQGKSEGR